MKEQFVPYDQALALMGYRQLQKGVWAKPVGHHLLTFEIKNNLFSNYFKSQDGEVIHLWHSSTYNQEDTFLDWIKATECSTRLNINSFNSNFEFDNSLDYL